MGLLTAIRLSTPWAFIFIKLHVVGFSSFSICQGEKQNLSKHKFYSWNVLNEILIDAKLDPEDIEYSNLTSQLGDDNSCS